jgi:hypothetical protein
MKTSAFVYLSSLVFRLALPTAAVAARACSNASR